MTEAIASARQQLWTVDGIPGYMTTKEGGEVTAETSKATDGGNLVPEVMSSPAETSNIILTKLYRPALHGPILREWKRQVGRKRVPVSGYDADPDLGPVGQPTVYADAVLVRVTPPAYDANSSDPSTFELEFAVGAEA